MNHSDTPLPNYVTCRCQHCDGHIEFDASHAGESVACPHCGLETKLYVPKVPLNKPLQNIGVEIKRGVSPLGIAPLVLGIGACVFCWIPFLGLVAIPISAIGFLLAVIGITASLVGKKSGLSFPIGGAVACVVAILIALFVTGGISGLIVKSVNQSNSTNQKIPTESPVASSAAPATSPSGAVVESATPTPAGLPDATMPQPESSSGEQGWSKSLVVQQGDMRIQVELTSDEHFWPNNFPRTASYLDGFFKIKLSNMSNTKKIDFTTWRGKIFNMGKDYATLTDDNGNVYKLQNSDFSQYGQQDEFSIYPNQSYEDFLWFEKPVSNFKWLHLELPASNFGGSGMIRFEIPAMNQKATSATPMVFQQGDITVKINDVVHGFQTGESPTERGLIVKTSNFLLIAVSLINSSSNRIYDYATFRNSAMLTDDKGNTYRKIDSNITVADEFKGQVTAWQAPYPFRNKVFVNSCRIQPHQGRDDMLAFDIPDSPGTVLHLELSAENFGGSGKIKFEIPVSQIKNW